MDLYVINILQCYLMFHGNTQTISCNMWKIGGIFVKSAQASTCQHYIR